MISAQSSLMEVGRQLHAGESTVEETLDYMRTNGTSVILNWGEDTDCWECSWITNDKRYTGVQHDMRRAILESIVKLTKELIAAEPK